MDLWIYGNCSNEVHTEHAVTPIAASCRRSWISSSSCDRLSGAGLPARLLKEPFLTIWLSTDSRSIRLQASGGQSKGPCWFWQLLLSLALLLSLGLYLFLCLSSPSSSFAFTALMSHFTKRCQVKGLSPESRWSPTSFLRQSAVSWSESDIQKQHLLFYLNVAEGRTTRQKGQAIWLIAHSITLYGSALAFRHGTDGTFMHYLLDASTQFNNQCWLSHPLPVSLCVSVRFPMIRWASEYSVWAFFKL